LSSKGSSRAIDAAKNVKALEAMNGQWIGDYAGTSSGTLLVNVDDRGAHFEGVAYIRPHGNDIPHTGVGFRTVSKDSEFQFVTRDFWAMHPRTGDPASWEDIKQFYPAGFSVSKQIDITGRWDESHLELAWRTDVGSSGTSDLPRSRASQPSELRALQMGWGEFKAYISGLAGKRHLFRGQNAQWRLRTAFHRYGRADLRRFTNVDIKVLHRRLSVRTRHMFDLSKPDENGAFFNLVQHHGYPTPLLDWTYSPYVAAFFAFREVSKSEAAGADSSKRVRIFVLDERWRTDVNQLVVLDRAFPHFSINEFIAIENERMIPQQSVSAVTNVDDIETYIRAMERTNGQSYLSAIDLPVCERSKIFCELGYMGLTAGSLFPGLDGACEELRESNF
jgi:hypothetical protein